GGWFKEGPEAGAGRGGGGKPLIVAARVAQVGLERHEARPREARLELAHRAVARAVVHDPGHDLAVRRRLELGERAETARRVVLAVPVENHDVHSPHRGSVMEKREPARTVVPLSCSGGGAGRTDGP